jgi:hypothetical protein
MKRAAGGSSFLGMTKVYGTWAQPDGFGDAGPIVKFEVPTCASAYAMNCASKSVTLEMNFSERGSTEPSRAVHASWRFHIGSSRCSTRELGRRRLPAPDS